MSDIEREATSAGQESVTQLSELMRGLEIGPGMAAMKPHGFYALGKAIAEQAKKAASVQDDRISVHEYTARMALQALEEYAENLSIVAGWDYEPLEHHYAQQAIEDIQDKLTEQEKGHE